MMRVISKIKFVIMSVLYCTNTFAQVSGSSLFPDVRALNPATISSRESGVLSVTLRKDKIDKKQDLSPDYGAGATGQTLIDVQTLHFFKGSRAGVITTEFLFDYATGTKVDSLKSQSTNVNSSDNVSSRYFTFGFGFGKFFGLSIGSLRYEYENNFKNSFEGQSINFNFKSKTDVFVIKAGTRFSMGLDIGLYIEKSSHTQTTENFAISSELKSDKKSFVLGIGKRLRNFHIELGHEKDIDSEDITLKPTKSIFTLELRFGKIAIGYIGSLYTDGFVDLEKLLYNNLVYSNSYEARIEHSFNFSFGSSKGHSYSGSFIYSKVDTKEAGALFAGGNEYDTNVAALGVSLKYGYGY